MAMDIEWWGYEHIDGSLHTKRFFSREDLSEARQSPFVKTVIDPFLADSKQASLDYLKRALKLRKEKKQ